MDSLISLVLLIDNHPSLLIKTIFLRPTNPWYNEKLHELLERNVGRKWRKGKKISVDHDIYRNHFASVDKLLKETRVNFYSEKIL